MSLSMCFMSAGHVVKKPKLEDAERLQREVVQLLEQHVDIPSLLREAGVRDNKLTHTTSTT